MSFGYDDLLQSFNYDNTEDALRDIATKMATGHKEADLIVPHANQLGGLLDQVNVELANPATTIDRLHQMREYLVKAMTAYQRILAGPWKDGRAAKGGYETMFGNPGYARLTLENLDKQLVEKSGGSVAGGPPGSAAAASTNNTLLLAGLAIGAVVLLK